MVKDMLGKGYGIALDVGTTTVVMSLMDLETGAELATVSDFNAQRRVGQDVLTRITYECGMGQKAIHRLQELVVRTINELVEQVCAKASVCKADISEIVVAANCTMVHMLLGRDARGMGTSPYKPQFVDAQKVYAKEIGVFAGEQTVIYCVPQVAAFLGGDVVAGLYECGLHQSEGITLFLDIGTNGEIVLAGKTGLISCSCAVGPALEGMNIGQGMPAKEGAIEDVKIHGDKVNLRVIGDGMPKGLCGSGVLSAIRELVKNGRIDKTGRLFPDFDGEESVTLCEVPQIKLTQKDIRQVQLAKGAILAAIKTLLQHKDIEMKDISRVLVAGQFGEHLSETVLIDTGILPKEAEGKIVYVGNTSRKGAAKALLSKAAKEQMELLAKELTYIELSNTEDYMKLFMESMEF